MQENKTVLYLDDNADHLELLKFLFEQTNYKVITSSSQIDCLQSLHSGKVSAVVMDYWVEGSETLDTGKKIREDFPQTPLFFFSGDVREASRRKALDIGAKAFFVKPDDIENIVATIDRHLEVSN